MGFYVRKSLKAAPFRFNVSKSGLGVSAGVPGFRVGTGPRGNYVHAGSHGVYYPSIPRRQAAQGAARHDALVGQAFPPSGQQRDRPRKCHRRFGSRSCSNRRR